ncbi:MAG: ferrous iron transport protein A [Bdellovibrionales bacterium]|nr:ferrous iron transport protein A [Bdellovibrionales bacterium]
MKFLSQMNTGETAKIKDIIQVNILTRFREMGLTINSSVQLLGKLPFGGNLIILSDYGKYTIRKQTAEKIKVDSS